MLEGFRSFVGFGINALILDFNPTETPLPDAWGSGENLGASRAGFLPVVSTYDWSDGYDEAPPGPPVCKRTEPMPLPILFLNPGILEYLLLPNGA